MLVVTKTLKRVICGEKLISTNGSLPYEVRQLCKNPPVWSAKAGLHILVGTTTQLGAINYCQEYEDALYKGK